MKNNKNIVKIKVFDLKNTEVAAVDYEGCGWSVLIVRHGNPAAIIYLPRALAGKSFEEVVTEVDFSTVMWEAGARETTEAYVGMCSDYEFTAFMRLGEPDYKMVAYDDGETVIEHITGDLYITGYKAEKKRYAVRLDEQDFIGVKNWALNFKSDADVWTRYKEDYSGRWTIVRLYDKDGEEAHTLEACGDGRFKENDYSYWCEATLEAFDADGELLDLQTLGFIAEQDAKRWVW